MKLSVTLHTLIVMACVLFVGSFAFGYFAHSSPAPSPTVKAAAAHAQVETAAAAKAETVFVHDKELAHATLTRYDTARVHDTVTVGQVVYVARDVADSTIHACTEAVSSCSIALAAKDTALAAKDVVIASLTADRPSRLHEILKDAALVGVGYGLGRIGINVRIPF